MTAEPLEVAYFILILAIVGYLIGISMLRLLRPSETSPAFAVAGFLYLFGRAGLVAALFLMTWKQTVQIDLAASSWESLILVGLFGLMTTWSVLPLVLSVVVDRFGKNVSDQKQGQLNV